MDVPRAKSIVRAMKGVPGGRGVRWPVRDADMNVAGYMRGFDRSCLNDSQLIETMAKWHTAYKEFFLTQFVVTRENKKNWLEKSVLENDLKMLFLIETKDGRVVGQDGFSIDDDGYLYLDGTMRWGRGGHPDLFRRDILERVAIGYNLLRCRECVAEVFKDNQLALNNLLSLGFQVLDEAPLSMTTEGSVVRYVLRDDASAADTDRTLFRMTMRESFFLARYGEIITSPSWSGFEFVK